MAIKLITFDLAAGGDVLVNREAVAAVLPREGGGSIIRLLGGAGELAVAEALDDVWVALEREGIEPRRPV
jgi:hypothetical protein